MYGLVAESCFFIGVDVKRYYVNIGLLDFKKNLVTVNIKVPFLLENTQASLNQLIELIRNFINDLPDTQKPVLAICVNLSGRINTTSGYSYSFFHFNEEPLTITLENALGIRTFLENDSRPMGNFIAVWYRMRRMCFSSTSIMELVSES